MKCTIYNRHVSSGAWETVIGLRTSFALQPLFVWHGNCPEDPEEWIMLSFSSLCLLSWLAGGNGKVGVLYTFFRNFFSFTVIWLSAFEVGVPSEMG